MTGKPPEPDHLPFVYASQSAGFDDLDEGSAIWRDDFSFLWQPTPRTIPDWQQRPWQRHRWQVQDQWWNRDGKRGEKLIGRTDARRLSVVTLRCLVCLRSPETLRRDQVCQACEKNWRRLGRPWGEDYERWVLWRRVAAAEEYEQDWRSSRRTESTEESPLGRLAEYDRLVRGTITHNEPLTRGSRTPLIWVQYNGEWCFVPGSFLAEEFQATADSLPHLTWPTRLAAFYLYIQTETIMPAAIELTLRGTPESVVAAIRRMGSAAAAEEPDVASFLDSLPGELGKVIKMRRARLSA